MRIEDGDGRGQKRKVADGNCGARQGPWWCSLNASSRGRGEGRQKHQQWSKVHKGCFHADVFPVSLALRMPPPDLNVTFLCALIL